MKTTKLGKQGNGTSVVIPAQILRDFGLRRGDEVAVQETPDGILITPASAELHDQMKLLDQVTNRFDQTFQDLAK
jgi:AbrB family looped-hinge helix DNA binding protein